MDADDDKIIKEQLTLIENNQDTVNHAIRNHITKCHYNTYTETRRKHTEQRKLSSKYYAQNTTKPTT